MFRHVAGTLYFILIACASVPAQPQSGVRLDHPRLYDLQSTGFEVTEATHVEIDCVAIRMKFGHDSYTGAWLVSDVGDREIWRSDSRRGIMENGSRIMFRQRAEVDLQPGRYLLYQFGGGRWNTDEPFTNWQNALNDLADMLNKERPDRNPEDYLDRCYVTLTMPNGGRSQQVWSPEAIDRGFLDLTGIGDDADETLTLRIDQETEVRILCAGEWSESGDRYYDYGWIEIALSGEPVWSMTSGNTMHGGGTTRNRISRETVRLSPGTYTVGYQSDGSHATGSWNAMPPTRPDLWGIRLSTDDHPAPRIVDPVNAERPDVLVSMLRVVDDQHLSVEFEMRTEGLVHIHALGEGHSSGMYDFGRILDAAGGGEVWAMVYDDCRHAGGTKRNLVFDGDISLPAGHYQAVYVTDDSHSYAGWNSPPPNEPSRYGMVILAR